MDFDVGTSIFGLFIDGENSATYLGLIIVIIVVGLIFVLYFLNKKNIVDMKKISSNTIGLIPINKKTSKPGFFPEKNVFVQKIIFN